MPTIDQCHNFTKVQLGKGTALLIRAWIRSDVQGHVWLTNGHITGNPTAEQVAAKEICHPAALWRTQSFTYESITPQTSISPGVSSARCPCKCCHGRGTWVPAVLTWWELGTSSASWASLRRQREGEAERERNREQSKRKQHYKLICANWKQKGCCAVRHFFF